MTAGISSYSIFETMRWGFARATQANEAGVGTATIPHSMSQSNSPFTQGVLAMASVFSNGIICLLSGLAILLGTNWTAPGTIFDAQLMAQAFSNHFNEFGAILIGASAFLFAFGTILGNCYNGSQCFSYVTNKRFIVVYQVFCALAVLLGTLFDLRYVWGFTDFFIIPVVIPHIIGIVVLAYKRRNLFDRQA
jgi:AGCS family alanine or glycine:cation symporter